MRRGVIAAPAVLVAGAAMLLSAAPASAHVVPSTTIELAVHENDITAGLTLPTADLVTASGIAVPDDGAIDESTGARIAAYIEEHFAIESGSGAWDVEVADVGSADTEQWGTGVFPAVTAIATLTPPTGSELRSFELAYDAIVHQVVTADIYVILNSDWATGELESSRTLGAITVDTVTGAVPSLAVDLDNGSPWQGFAGMLALGVSHIAEGTDHQLFLLTLLLPAPLIAIDRRWSRVAPAGTAVRRIAAITIAFTLGHSVTLALGTLGLPVPQRPIEALIAVSILIAAWHAIRPLFPGREALVAGLFGLVHGMAFSATLSELELSGAQLVLSLLGFNLGIEIMQLLVVLLVLPPLVILARTPAYTSVRVVAAIVTGAAATGWLLDRVGVPNALGTAADALAVVSPWTAAALWAAAVAVLIRTRLIRTRHLGGPARRRGSAGDSSGVDPDAAPAQTR